MILFTFQLTSSWDVFHWPMWGPLLAQRKVGGRSPGHLPLIIVLEATWFFPEGLVNDLISSAILCGILICKVFQFQLTNTSKRIVQLVIGIEKWRWLGSLLSDHTYHKATDSSFFKNWKGQLSEILVPLGQTKSSVSYVVYVFVYWEAINPSTLNFKMILHGAYIRWLGSPMIWK